MEAETLRTQALESRGSEAAPSLIVVDDDRFIARLLEIELTAAGYDVRAANDGERRSSSPSSAARSSSSPTS